MTTLSSRRKSTSATLLLILLLIFGGALVAGFLLFFEGGSPTVTIKAPASYLGTSGTIGIGAQDDESGLRRLRATLSQGAVEKELLSDSYPRLGYTGMIGVAEKQVDIDVQPAQQGFADGPATLTVTAVDYSCRGFFRGNTVTITRELIIDTTAPKMGILYSDRYVSPGGSGLIIYRVDDSSAASGVLINDSFHPGFLSNDGRDDIYVALFALPYDAETISGAQIVAKDPAGNQASLPFSTTFKAVSFKQDRITVDDRFLETKIPEFQRYYPEMTGSLLEQYLFINTTVRKQNNQMISSFCKNPQGKRLWQGHFARMPGSPRAGYADHRTYFYNGEAIDKQVHLGIDIASTRQAEVRAAATGIVVHADYLGIYGNMVLLDHGQGLFSLYSHLSQINVSEGDTVEAETPIGRTGTSGMAGGDHLHFSMLVNGIFVTPVEWWDQHWIDVNIEGPLQDARFQ
ncbi:M23 family metallopeptidase [Desulfofustis glycolicus]|uniref:Peptidase family M23 n=1 Tax=Desulfofustis glycolicus DSM 9705 TaxID=1121409 RepID=A0A1M5WWP8_9BACT|nr:M23 family metallopeptidase [Desulfofustis glycolicus]SHH91748.1 Peptidase family M23 [Desulfofustis glycolicus DSM 9705]